MRVERKKAARDYPRDGIKKGEYYYTWTPFRQRPRRSLTPPRRSQLTSSEGRAALYDAYDDLTLDPADPAGSIRDLGEAVRAAGELFQELFDDLNEGLRAGPVGQRLEESASACEAAADELAAIADEVERGELSPDEVVAAARNTEPGT